LKRYIEEIHIDPAHAAILEGLAAQEMHWIEVFLI
jgi:hypothetical protein